MSNIWTTTPQFPDFFQWYHATTNFVRDPSSLPPDANITFIMGNESCDLDSFSSSISLAYLCECAKKSPLLFGSSSTPSFFPQHLKKLYNIPSHLSEITQSHLHQLENHHFIPIITVSKDQFEIRSLITHIVTLLDINHDVISIQDVISSGIFEEFGFIDASKQTILSNSNPISINNRITFMLVDHNKPTPILSKLFSQYISPGFQIIGILDHHVDDNYFQTTHFDDQTTIPTIPRDIYFCSSTTTTIINSLAATLQLTLPYALECVKSTNSKPVSQPKPRQISSDSSSIFFVNPLESILTPEEHKQRLITTLFPSTLNANSLPLLSPKFHPSHPQYAIARNNHISSSPTPLHLSSTTSYLSTLSTFPSHVKFANLLLLGDLILYTIIIDSVGLQSSHGKRTQHDDVALFHLGLSSLLPSKLPNSSIDPQFLPTQLHQQLTTSLVSSLISSGTLIPTSTSLSPTESLFTPLQQLLKHTSTLSSNNQQQMDAAHLSTLIDAILTQLTTSLFTLLSSLLTETSKLTLSQLLHLDSKQVVCTGHQANNNNKTDSTSISILFSAVPTSMQELLSNTRRISSNTSTNSDMVESPGFNVLNALHAEHHHGKYDIILLCCYYQELNTTYSDLAGPLQREIIISIPNTPPSFANTNDSTSTTTLNNQSGQDLFAHLTRELMNDSKLGTFKYPFANGPIDEAIFQSTAHDTFCLSIDLLKQQNSTLSRKYMLPLITDICNSFFSQ